MSTKLDEELAEVLANQGDVGHGTTVAKAVPPGERVAPPRRKNVGLLVTLLGIAGGMTALFLFGFKEAAVYAMPIDRLAREKASLVGRKVRVEGDLVPGTLVKRDKPCEYRFTLYKDQDELPVSYKQCVIPDGFRDMPGGVTVTIEGSLNRQGEFDASLVMAKCASKYDPTTHQMVSDTPIN